MGRLGGGGSPWVGVPHRTLNIDASGTPTANEIQPAAPATAAGTAAGAAVVIIVLV